jgi:cold shock CspA family protein
MKRTGGRIVTWFGDKAFGFILADGPARPEVFCHLHDCTPGVRGFVEGSRVSYIEAMGLKGIKALDCRPDEMIMPESQIADRSEKLSH